MNALAVETLEILARMGPALVLLLAFLETVFVTGLFMPTGPVIILCTLIAGSIGSYEVQSVVVAAVLGGVLGDSGGFWVGRRLGPRILAGDGRVGRAVGRHLPRAASLAGHHPVMGVTFARLVSFVRTLTPPLAGMSRLTYPRFLFYDLMGIGGWVAIYVGVAVLAGEGWRTATGWIGAAWVALFVLGVLVLWFWAWRRKVASAVIQADRGSGPDAAEGPPC